jgi:RimJ/RimL family protein N-acetyltransferase
MCPTSSSTRPGAANASGAVGEAERLTREKGLKRLVIGVMAGNAAAERLYGELGFSVYAKAMMKPL